MLSTEQLPGITTLTLQRPERGNALGPELVEALIGLDLGGLLGLVDDEWAMRILSWAVADELDQA